jgi:hypothetical protein
MVVALVVDIVMDLVQLHLNLVAQEEAVLEMVVPVVDCFLKEIVERVFKQLAEAAVVALVVQQLTEMVVLV